MFIVNFTQKARTLQSSRAPSNKITRTKRIETESLRVSGIRQNHFCIDIQLFMSIQNRKHSSGKCVGRKN